MFHEGQVVGPYRIVALAGSGGMGEVWRARDDRLERDVALKVLRAGVGDEAARRHLLAEARAVTALNHPNIVVVHDVLSVDGRDVLVMEYVAGKPLTERTPPGGMKLREALKIAIAVADAVAAAHAAGVIHRDLKPGNVLVSLSGAVKVLDFGLARRRVHAGPTDVTIPGDPQSVEGLVSGTPAYMSPEHAEGGIVDHRSDIFSFGASLYELLTGQRPFERRSMPETLTAVIKEEPRLPAGWPPALATVVRRCLRKDPDRRFQSMADVRVELQEVLEEHDHPESIVNSDSTPGVPRAWMTTFIVAALALAVGAWFLGRREQPTWRVLPVTTHAGLEQQPVISPKGDQVAFMWDGGTPGDHNIYVQQLSGATPPLQVTNHPAPESSPVWSSDGSQLAFLRVQGDGADVMLASPLGGSERRIGYVPGNQFTVTGLFPPSKIDWSPDGQFIALGTATLSLLNVATGELRQLPAAPTKGTDRDPAFSLDGRSIAYTRGQVTSQIWVQRIHADGSADGTPEAITRDYQRFFGLTWLDSSSLLTSAGWAGSAVRLLQVSKDGRQRPLPVESVAAWYPSYSVKYRRLVYQRRTIDIDVLRINLDDRAAPMEAHPLIKSTFQDRDAKYSPDETKIVFISTRSGQPAVWRANADGTNQILLAVVNEGIPGSPRWLPDGTAVVFDAVSPASGGDIYIVGAEGGTPRRVTSLPGDEFAPSVSRDGRWVYFRSETTIFKAPVAGGEPVRVADRVGGGGQESSDGRWFYYVRENDLWRIPTSGGPEERFQSNVPSVGWTLTDHELFVLRLAGDTPGTLVAYDLETRRERLERQLPRELRLFSARWLDVTADGRAALISPIVRDESDIVLVEGIR